MDAQYPQPSAVQRLIPEILCNLCFPSITILQELLLVIQQLLKQDMQPDEHSPGQH